MFPNLKGKKFLDLSKNSPVSVIDQFENIVILDNKQRIDVNRLLDKGFYDDYIDPASFFNSEKTYQTFSDKIKSIPDEVLASLKDDDTSIVTPYDPEEEKRALMEKARQMTNPANSVSKQVESLKAFMDEDDELNIHLPSNINQESPQTIIKEPVTQPSNLPVNLPVPTVQNSIDQTVQKAVIQSTFIQDDPMITMFKNTKKNTDLRIYFEVISKIPRPDFIEMMEDSYEISIIDYLSDQFTQDILRDPSIIREKVKEEIKKIVYKEKSSSPTPSTTSEKPKRIIRKKVEQK